MKNRLLFGILLGTIVPFVFAVLVKVIFYSFIPFSNFVEYPHLFSPFLQWGIIANLLVFFYFLQKNDNEVQRGIVFPTVFYTMAVMLIKYFLY